MKTIGLIGGMSWESTVTYYQVINETIRKELGGLHSAKILLYSIDFDELEKHQSAGEWEQCADILSDVALRLEKAGADFILICANTPHEVAPQVQERISVPLLHIANLTAAKLKEQRIETAGLLGTKYTMTQDFVKERLVAAGIRVIVPDEEDMDTVHSVIFQELCCGEIRPQSKEKFIQIIGRLKEKGAQGIIFGCTEIGLLLNPEDSVLPVFDTTLIHAEKAALEALTD